MKNLNCVYVVTLSFIDFFKLEEGAVEGKAKLMRKEYLNLVVHGIIN